MILCKSNVNLERLWGHFGAKLGQVEPNWLQVGPKFAQVGPKLAHSGFVGGPCPFKFENVLPAEAGSIKKK